MCGSCAWRARSAVRVAASQALSRESHRVSYRSSFAWCMGARKAVAVGGTFGVSARVGSRGLHVSSLPSLPRVRGGGVRSTLYPSLWFVAVLLQKTYIRCMRTRPGREADPAQAPRFPRTSIRTYSYSANTVLTPLRTGHETHWRARTITRSPTSDTAYRRRITSSSAGTRPALPVRAGSDVL